MCNLYITNNTKQNCNLFVREKQDCDGLLVPAFNKVICAITFSAEMTLSLHSSAFVWKENVLLTTMFKHSIKPKRCATCYWLIIVSMFIMKVSEGWMNENAISRYPEQIEFIKAFNGRFTKWIVIWQTFYRFKKAGEFWDVLLVWVSWAALYDTSDSAEAASVIH